MDRTIMEQWVRDLRSGSYAQRGGSLRVNETFCALGVLGDQYVNATDASWESMGCARGTAYAIEGCTGSLNRSIRGWAGISTDLHDRIMALNDSGTLSFPQIAAYIEDHFLPPLMLGTGPVPSEQPVEEIIVEAVEELELVMA